MTTEIRVPELGESIVEATVADWLKQEGDRVEIGEAVVVLETEKVDLDVGATVAGVLVHIEHQTGDDVKIGDVLGIIEEVEAGEPAAPEAPKPEAAEKAPDAPKLEVVEKAPEAPIKETSAPAITPVARRLAEDRGVDITRVAASGPQGRVTKEDVERYLSEQTAPKPREPQPQAAPPATPAPKVEIAPAASPSRREERQRLSRRRRTIAVRLVEAQHTAAMLTTFNEVDMTAVMDLRKRRQPAFVERYGVKLGIASFFVKASIGALKAFPQVNAELQGDELVLKYYYDIGMAIGAPEGLVVPVLRDADRMSFGVIEQTIKDMAQRATDGQLTLEELRGGTFTITNGGIFGSLMSTPILNPPQVAILGLHKIEDRPVALNGEIVIRPMMYVALSYDHRVIDGREAVQFLVRVKELIEDPETLLLEG
jgi:2-oxoglutarate dehydrogenase E2 component (dihydrolipoamide succinyltransferase)